MYQKKKRTIPDFLDLPHYMRHIHILEFEQAELIDSKQKFFTCILSGDIN